MLAIYGGNVKKCRQDSHKVAGSCWSGKTQDSEEHWSTMAASTQSHRSRFGGLRTVRETVLAALLSTMCVFQMAEACGNVTGDCKFMDFCLQDSDCEPGLSCSSCPSAGISAQQCYRDKASPTRNDSLPFNKYSWLTTHNSYAWSGAPELTGPRITNINQDDDIAQQLQNGVRGLMLDTYDFLGQIWLCHSTGGACFPFTTFEPLQATLAVIESFLAANPTEVVTLFLEDYVMSANGLSNAFDAAGLRKYWFPAASMPQTGGDWPTLRQMVANNWRLLVFTSMSAKESSQGIPYQWKYVVENQYGDAGQVSGQCPKRAESADLNDKSRSLVLMNYFPSDPASDLACVQNNDPEFSMVPICHTAAGNRWANYLAVDYYKRSQGGGAFQAVDFLVKAQMQ